MSYLGNSPGVSSQRTTSSYTATSGQTTFTATGGYQLGYVDVYLNGTKLVTSTDYTASNGTSVVLVSGANVGDSVDVVSYQPRGLSDGYLKSEADAKYELLASKGTANGYASLDGSAKVPSSQLPSYVDDVLEATNFAALPATGTTGIIYITLDTNYTYRWTGSTYVQVGGGSAGGSSGQVQYNNAGAFAGSANFTFDGTNIAVASRTFGRGAATSGGVNNVAAGQNALSSNTTGEFSIAMGYNALAAQTIGSSNTGLGNAALAAVISGNNNTGVGRNAFGNTTASDNTGVGYFAGINTTTGANNTAVGSSALQSNTTASYNTAVGAQALYAANRTADGQAWNVSIGYQSGYSLTTGQFSTFVGAQAGYYTTGNNNTFVGPFSGYYVTSGASNTILGRYGGNQDGLDIRSSSNYVVLSDGDGNRQASMAEGKSLALDSAVPQSGTGITFPATQSASSNANTLDDYEEGSWTGTLTGGTSNPTTPVTATGYYTKIGRQVTASIYFSNVNTTGASGSVTITGLPFSSNASIRNAGSGFSNLFTFFTNTTAWSATANGTTIYFDCYGSDVAGSDLQHNAGTGRYLRAQVSYQV